MSASTALRKDLQYVPQGKMRKIWAQVLLYGVATIGRSPLVCPSFGQRPARSNLKPRSIPFRRYGSRLCRSSVTMCWCSNWRLLAALS